MKKVFLILKIVGYILIPAILIFLPSDYFDAGSPKCLSVLLLGQECYACGLTRSIMHLIHFEFADTFYFHPLGFVVFPLLAYLWAKWFLRDWKMLKTQF